jgi:prepilin-type processing-associated H-X9-DG protein
LIAGYLGGDIETGLQCPAFNYDGGWYIPKFNVQSADYGLNYYLSPQVTGLPSGNHAFKITQVRHLTTTVVFADAVQMDGLVAPPSSTYSEPYFLDNEESMNPNYGGFVQWRHRKRANVAYLDGHVDEVSESNGIVIHVNIGGSDVGNLTSGNAGPETPYGNPDPNYHYP